MVKTFHDRNQDKPAAPASESVPGGRLFADMEARKQAVARPPEQAAPDAVATPAPLFRPTVHADRAAGQRERIEAALARLNLNDYMLDDGEISRIIQLQDDIRLDDPLYISEFGTSLGEFSDTILNRLAEIAHNQYPDQIRSYLNAILQQTRRINLDALQGGRRGLIQSLFSRGVTDRNGFRQVEQDITAITALCLEKLSALKKSQLAFVELLEKNELQFRSITTKLAAGQLRVAEELAAQSVESVAPGDFFARQQYQDHQEALQRFERRLHNLALLRQTVLLRMSQLRLEQKNIHALIDQTHETITLLIPAWRQQVMALFSATPADSQTALYEQLASTQQALQERLQALNTRKDPS